MFNHAFICRLLLMAVFTAVSGCTVHPPGERAERAAALEAGKPFADRLEVRRIPPLPENPTPDQLVEHALLTSAELEQHYWEWRAAIEQIPQDGTQATTLNLSAGTSITKGRADWAGTTVGLSNDPMTDIKWPGKLDAAARQTLENARAAGRRFLKAKYELRNKVLSAWYDYSLTAELIRLEQRNEQSLETTATITAARNRAANGSQPDLVKAENQTDMSRNDIANMQSQLETERAAINALLNRPVAASLPVPTDLPEARRLAYDDGQLADLAATCNPELIALADEIRGRRQGIRLARLQYVPDFNLSAGTDLMGIAQSVLGQATIPLFKYEALNAAVEQAEANFRASEAMRRQTGNDLIAQVIADIATIRDADRQLELFHRTIRPRASEAVAIERSAYESGRITLLDLLDDQRSLIAIDRLVASVRIIREKRLVDLEAITSKKLSAGPPAWPL